MEKTKQDIINHLLTTNNFSTTNEDLQEVITKLEIKPRYPIILVGGTNGKGSTCAYLSTILTHAGYKVGTFTSPHVFDYNERIQINNKPINDDKLVNILTTVINASNTNFGIFKTFTLASHIIFMAENIDIAIIEVGLGGTKDATNIFEPTISAITGVDFDHCAILGNSLESIGLEKSGIFRPNKAAFYGASNPPLSVLETAKKLGSKFIQYDKNFYYKKRGHCWDFYHSECNYYSLPFPSMRGSEQLLNASLALAILVELKNQFPLSISQIKNGLLQTHIIGRFQVMPGTPQIIFDTAHNGQAIEMMYQNMIKLQFAKRNFAVFAIADDKDWESIIEKHAKNFDYWFLSSIDSERSANPLYIKQKLSQYGVQTNNIDVSNSVQEAFTKAYQALKNEDRMVCFGSFLVVEQAYRTLQGIRK